MASFQTKIGWERLRKRETKPYRSVTFLPNGLEKIPKKLQKIKNTVLATFQINIDWKRLRKRENKPYRSVTFQPDVLEKIPKK